MATQTLTFLFTDIEGSTTMVQRLGDAETTAGPQVRQAARITAVPYGG